MVAPSLNLIRGRRPISRRVIDQVFGYDFFISYSWSDGSTYARDLARALQLHGFQVFLDAERYAIGDDWKQIGAWTLRQTGHLVLVATRGALEVRGSTEAPVEREVRLFSQTGRRILPIGFTRPDAAYAESSIEEARPSSRVLKYLPPDAISIMESVRCLETGPSQEAIERLVHSFELIRQDRKRARVFGLVSGLLAALACAAILFGWLASRAAEHERTARRVAEQQQADGLVLEGIALRREQRWDDVGPPLRDAQSIYDRLGMDALPARFAKWHLARVHVSASAVLDSQANFRAVALAGDGSLIALGLDGEVQLLTSNAQPLRKLVLNTARPLSLALDQRGQRLAVSIPSGLALYSDPRSGEYSQIVLTSDVRRMSFAFSGPNLVAALVDGTVAFVNTETKAVVRIQERIDGDVTGLSFVEDDAHAAVTTRSGHVYIVDAALGKIVTEFPTRGPAQGVAGTLGTRAITFGEAGGRVRYRRWDARQDDSQGLAVGDVVLDVAALPSEGWGVVALDSGRVLSWDFASGTILRDLTGATGPFRAIRVARGDEPTVLALGTQGRVYLWHLSQPGYVRRDIGFIASSVSIDAGGCEGRNAAGRMARMSNGGIAAQVAPTRTPSCSIGSVALSAAGSRVLCLDSSGSASILSRNAPPANVGSRGIRYTAGWISEDRVVLATSEGQLQVFDSHFDRPSRTAQSDSNAIREVALAGDGRFVVAASESLLVEIIDLSRGRRIDAFSFEDNAGFKTPISAIALCRTGDCVAFATKNRILHCAWWGSFPLR